MTKKMTKKEIYLSAGLKLCPSGVINEHLYTKYVLGGVSSMKDETWMRTSKAGRPVVGYHTCCGSKRSYRHKVGCERIRDLTSDDYSDLKDI